MSKSKIAIFRLAGVPMELETVEIPNLKEAEILVKNEYTTLCRSDLYTFAGKRKEKVPTILGHEIVGSIADFGHSKPHYDLKGTLLQRGDRISWAIFASDPNDPRSIAGIPQKAKDLFKYGHEQITPNSTLHGGLAEFTILRRNTPVAKLDRKLPLPVAAIINCAAATVAGGLRLAGNLVNKHVLITGFGMLGMVAAAMFRVKGAQVSVLDIKQDRLKLAPEFGANFSFLSTEDFSTSIRSEFKEDRPFDLIFELTGISQVIEQSLSLLRIGGTAVWIGATYPQPELSLSAERVVRNLWTIKGLHNYNQFDFLNAVEFMEKHYQEFPFEHLIYDHFNLDQVNEAFEYGLKVNPLRVGIRI